MITYLTKSDASEGFEKIIDFSNTNDVVRLQALIDRRKVIITEDTIRQALRSDDAKSINCLPNEEIFAELVRMGYEKPSTKLTFYKVFANMRRVGKGFFRVDTPLFEGMLVPQQVQVGIDAGAEDEDVVEPTSPTPGTTPTPPQELIPSTSQVSSTPPPSPHQSPIAQPSLPPQQQPSQPLHTTNISMDLLNTLLETCTTLTRKVKNLEQDKITQALEITKLKQRVRRLEKKRKLKVLGFIKLRKVGTTHRVESSANTVMDDQEDASKYGEIAKLDADEDVTLEEVAAEVAKDAEDDETEPAELKEVIELVTTTKLMIEVVTATATTITAAPGAARRRKGVVIRDPEETATPSVIVHSESKSKDKGKGILVEEPKPLKKQAQIEHDEAYARELEAELNANINWNEVIEQVKGKEKQDNTVLRYQALKRKPQTKAHARKNMMVYLKNMAGFKLDFFKGMSYDDIRPIFEKHFNSIVSFLEKREKELEEEASKRKNDVYTKATPLALKVPVVDFQIHFENKKPYYKITRADGTHQLFLSVISLLRNFDKEDLEMLWKIVKERFASLEPKNFSGDFLLNTLKTLFEKPDVEASIWKS
nr:hypothetical protein [Tanacetum cinerariifolium]